MLYLGGGKLFSFFKKERKVIINNEEVTDANVKNSNIDLKKEYIEDILRTKKVPIVLLDPLWHAAKEHIKSKIIDKEEKELQDLLKEQGKLNTDYKEYTVIKQNFLKEILLVSGKVQESNHPDHLEELNKLHQSTLGANQKLEDIERRLEEIDAKIEEKNKMLVSEMIAVGYSYIDNYKEQNEKLENEIAALREKLLEKTNKKKSNDAFLKEIYNYLHSIVGREQIEIIDKSLGEQK